MNDEQKNASRRDILRLASLAGLDLWHPPGGLAAELRAALRLPEPTQLRICHGDLHLRHMLVGDDGEPSAVIDWIDVCRADPVTDAHEMSSWVNMPVPRII